MKVLEWFLWRRWLFKNWMKDGDFSCEWLLLQCKSFNFAGCKYHPVIYRDMEKILWKIKRKL